MQPTSLPPPLSTPSTGDSAVRAKPRILVVDDQPMNIRILNMVLTADYQVLMATSGEQALLLSASQLPDLVLLDVVMPGMDGHEVCRWLKASPATQAIPVVFVTASDDPLEHQRCLAAGGVAVLTKPVDPHAVLATVRGLVV